MISQGNRLLYIFKFDAKIKFLEIKNKIKNFWSWY